MSFVSTSQTFCHVFKLPSWIINLNTDTFRLELQTYVLFHIIKGIAAVGSYLARGYKPERSPLPPRNWKGRCCSGQGLVLPGLWRGPSLCASLSVPSVPSETGQQKTKLILYAYGHCWRWPFELRGTLGPNTQFMGKFMHREKSKHARPPGCPSLLQLPLFLQRRTWRGWEWPWQWCHPHRTEIYREVPKCQEW